MSPSMNIRILSLAAMALLAVPAFAADVAVPAPKPDSRFLQPLPLDFNDREGFVSLFDGTLDGWEGDRRFWRAEDGMIVGENSQVNPSGNSYLT